MGESSDSVSFRYQVFRDWEGSIKKITQKEYTNAIGHGHFYRSEGTLIFKTNRAKQSYLSKGAIFI